MPTVLMHTRPLDEKEKIVTGPRVAWLPPYNTNNITLHYIIHKRVPKCRYLRKCGYSPGTYIRGLQPNVHFSSSAVNQSARLALWRPALGHDQRHLVSFQLPSIFLLPTAQHDA